MTPTHLTLLLILPAFVLGMFYQFSLHRRHYRARIAALTSLTRPPRTRTDAPEAFTAPPLLCPHYRADDITEIHPPLFRVEWDTTRGQIFEAYVHADTLDDAADAFRLKSGINEFRISGTQVIA